jgi:hypothetical protein
MDPSQLDYAAIFVAALSTFLLGGLWYSPVLFAKAWMREAGLTDAELGKGVAKVFAGAFACTLVASVNLAFFLGTDAGLAWGATAGALAGIGWVGMSLVTVWLFERRSGMLMLIDGGYLAVAYTVMGAVIGGWP